MSNFIQSICVYNHKNLWVFDDENFDLIREPFVSGMDKIISHFVKKMNLNVNGFNILFSIDPFPGYHTELEWQRKELGGNWYHCKELNLGGWLCPALEYYFQNIPIKLFAQFVNIS